MNDLGGGDAIYNKVYRGVEFVNGEPGENRVFFCGVLGELFYKL